MELKDTIELMCSDDWKDRFVAEYLQVKIRYEKLHRLIIKRELGEHGFDTPIPFQSWKDQAFHMGMYLYELEKQAVLHDIDLAEAEKSEGRRSRMSGREKVLSGLLCCADRNPEEWDNHMCKKCPYDAPFGCGHIIAADALELIERLLSKGDGVE